MVDRQKNIKSAPPTTIQLQLHNHNTTIIQPQYNHNNATTIKQYKTQQQHNNTAIITIC